MTDQSERELETAFFLFTFSPRALWLGFEPPDQSSVSVFHLRAKVALPRILPRRKRVSFDPNCVTSTKRAAAERRLNNL